MRKLNKKCICCGKVYSFCTGCREYDNQPRWKAIYHDENCKNIFNIANDYYAKIISADEAKELFSACDLTDKESFHSAIAKAIDEVMPKKKKETKTEE